jgi:lipoprotein-anchoring transpeptidase ErfK/SrfK
MHFPHLFVSAALAVLAAVFASAAQAQFQPPPYSYPQGGYRGVPDQDGVIRADPDDDLDDVEPLASERGRYGTVPSDQNAAAPYPYDPRAGRDPAYERRLPTDPQQYDPRYGRQQDGRQVGPAPGASPSPNYDTNYNSNSGYATQRPYGHYGDRMPADPGYAARPNDAPVPLQPYPDAQPRPPAPLAPPRQAFPPFPNIFAPQPQQQAQPPQQQGRPNTVAALPAEDQPEENPKELPQQFKRQIVPYASKEPAGTLIIDTNSTYLYYVQGDGTAVRYGIGVGREGFTWAGAEKVSRMAEWPDWHPPSEMIERQPYLPRFMAGGDGNPLGARALYLGKTIYRIHGTNQPSTIGKFVSSGCIRMLNADVEDLYQRVKVGTRVVVLPGGAPASASSSAPITR